MPKRLILNADNRSPDTEGYWKYMIQLTEQYAKKWNTEFKFVAYGSSLERHPSWERIKLLKTLIAEYDEILWLDTDASIINHNVDVFDYLKTAPESPTWIRTPDSTPVIYAVSDKPYTKFGCAGIFLLDCSDKSRAQEALDSWWADVPDEKYIQGHPWEQSVWNYSWALSETKRSWIRVADIWTTREEEKNQVFIHLIHSHKKKRMNEARYYQKRTLNPTSCQKKIGIFIDKKFENRKALYLRFLLEAQGHRVLFLTDNLPLKDCVIHNDAPYFIYNIPEIDINDFCMFVCTSFVPPKEFIEKIKPCKLVYLYDESLPPCALNYFDEIWHDIPFSNTDSEQVKKYCFARKLPILYDPCLNQIKSVISDTALEIAILGKSLVPDSTVLEILKSTNPAKVHFFNTPLKSGLHEHPWVKEKRMTLYSKIPIDDILGFFKNKNVIFISQVPYLTVEQLEVMKSGFRLLHSIRDFECGHFLQSIDPSCDISKLEFHDCSTFFERINIYKQSFLIQCFDPNPLLLTYDNKPNEASFFFFETLKANQWNFKQVGDGEIWKGFVTRMNGYLNCLKTLHPSQLVVLSDARDVICVRSPKAFQKAFEYFQKDIVVSMELFCEGQLIPPPDHKTRMWQCLPLDSYWKYYNFSKQPSRKFVNAGLIAGKAGALVEMYEWVLSNKFTDDQLGIGHYMVTFPQKIAADFDALLLHTSVFAVYSGLKDIHIQAEDAPTFAELFGRSAFFLHIPGTNNKGQCLLYNSVKDCVKKLGTNSSALTKPYGWDEPDWINPAKPSPFLQNNLVVTAPRLKIYEESLPSNTIGL